MADPASRSGARYADDRTLRFTAEIHAQHDAALDRAYESPAREEMPPISVGPNEGRTLELLLRLAGAKRVIEIGTLAGYSTIWMARALPPDGQIWTLELNPKHAAVARENLRYAGLADRVHVLVGKAHELLPKLEAEGPFCAVFIDADKERYALYGRWAAANLRRGGLLLGDNAYFFGRLFGDEPGARAMRTFHEETPSAFDSVCLPTPDGLLLGIRR